jgi:hypothetical protein
MLRFLVVLLLLLAFAAPADAQLPPLPGTGGPAPGAYRQNDAGGFRAVGGATQPLIHWINRPTFQRANEIRSQMKR